MLKEDFAVRTALRNLAAQESVLLLCVYVADKSLLCLEVERHGVALVLVGTHREHWRTEKRYASCVCLVLSARSVH